MNFRMNPNIAVGVSIMLFIVWEGRNSGWTDMFEALSGKLVLKGTRAASSGSGVQVGLQGITPAEAKKAGQIGSKLPSNIGNLPNLTPLLNQMQQPTSTNTSTNSQQNILPNPIS